MRILKIYCTKSHYIVVNIFSFLKYEINKNNEYVFDIKNKFLVVKSYFKY